VKIKILDQELELENHPSSIEMMFAKIEEKLKNTGLIFSSLTIDGLEISVDYAHYLSQNIANIKEIEVGTKSFRELLVETMSTAQEYLQRAIPEVEKLCDEFYRGPTADSWSNFAQLIEGLQWLLQVMTAVGSYTAGTEAQHPYAQREAEFREKIEALQAAMENSDYVLIADLMQYEISPLFSSLAEQIEQVLTTEGLANDLN
jgi:leucyl aminopeptidase (aminopeptidase T)